MAPAWLRGVPGAVELTVYAQPRASKSRVAGVHGEALKVQIAAPPVDGEANAELLRFFARLFDVPKARTSLLSGDTGRHKRVRIEGIDAAAAEAVISPLL